MAVKQGLIRTWLPQISPSFTYGFGSVESEIIPALKISNGAVNKLPINIYLLGIIFNCFSCQIA
jgi:hypothetical protein